MNEVTRKWVTNGWSTAAAIVAFGAAMVFSPAVRSQSVLNAPSHSTNGSYTVSFSACGASVCYIQERAGVNGTWANVSGQVGFLDTGYVAFSGRAEGIYQYRVEEMWVNTPWDIWYAYSPTAQVVVSVGPPPTVDSMAVQTTAYSYEVRRGDMNGDSLQDLFLRRTAGGAPGNGTIHTLILQGATGGKFTPIVPTSAQTSTALAWPTVPAGVTLIDFDTDGFADIKLSGLGSFIGGALDQIVVSSGALFDLRAKVLVPIDTKFTKFVGEVDRWTQNANYFNDNAPIVYVPVYGIDYYCGWYDRGDGYWEYTCYPYYVLLGYTAAYDFSGYDADAVAMTDAFGTDANGQVLPDIAPGSADGDTIGDIFQTVFGVPVMRGVLSSGCTDYVYDSDTTIPCLDLDLVGQIFLTGFSELTDHGDCRYLTAGERSISNGEGLAVLDLTSVKICNVGYFWFNSDIMAPNGNIYVGPGATSVLPWREDYSNEIIDYKATLVHELTHVYQVRTLGCGRPCMLWRKVVAGNDYVYTPWVPSKAWESYNIEEQAEMVQDRYRRALGDFAEILVNRNVPYGELDATIPFDRAP